MACFQGFRAQIFNQLVQTPTGYFPQSILVGTGLGICFLGRLLARNWQYNPIDVGIRQLQGYWRCDVGGAHTLSSANWGLQHSTSRSPYIANLLKRSYKTL